MVATPVSCYMQTHSTSLYMRGMYAERRSRGAVRGLSVCLLTPHTSSVCGTGTLMIITGVWQRDTCSASEEIPSISWNLIFHYCVHTSTPLILILCHINPVRSSYSAPFYLHVSFPSMPGSSKWSISLKFTRQDAVRSVSPLILKLSSRWRWVVNFTPLPLYPQEATPVHVG